MDPDKQVSPNVSGGDDNSRIDLLKRKTLRPWVGRPPADHSRRAVRQPREAGRKGGLSGGSSE